MSISHSPSVLSQPSIRWWLSLATKSSRESSKKKNRPGRSSRKPKAPGNRQCWLRSTPTQETSFGWISGTSHPKPDSSSRLPSSRRWPWAWAPSTGSRCPQPFRQDTWTQCHYPKWRWISWTLPCWQISTQGSLGLPVLLGTSISSWRPTETSPTITRQLIGSGRYMEVKTGSKSRSGWRRTLYRTKTSCSYTPLETSKSQAMSWEAMANLRQCRFPSYQSSIKSKTSSRRMDTQRIIGRSKWIWNL